MTELVRIFTRENDWHDFWSVVNESFPAREPDKDFLTDREYYALKENGRIIGSAIAEIESPDQVALYNICIIAEKRSQGFGGELMSKLTTTLSERFLYASLFTEPHNIGFYDQAGFELDPSLKTAYLHEMYKRLG